MKATVTLMMGDKVAHTASTNRAENYSDDELAAMTREAYVDWISGTLDPKIHQTSREAILAETRKNAAGMDAKIARS